MFLFLKPMTRQQSGASIYSAFAKFFVAEMKKPHPFLNEQGACIIGCRKPNCKRRDSFITSWCAMGLYGMVNAPMFATLKCVPWNDLNRNKNTMFFLLLLIFFDHQKYSF